jgi:hypothetical protein
MPYTSSSVIAQLLDKIKNNQKQTGREPGHILDVYINANEP